MISKTDLVAHLDTALAGLKDFQRASVEALRVGFVERDRPSMLLADEVGLGKTIVAKGLIASLLKQRLEEGKRKPLKVTYICSNQVIARENIRKLNPFPRELGMKDPITRISYLAYDFPAKTKGEPQGLLELSTLTPSTSFDLSQSNGNKWERRAIYAVLCSNKKLLNRKDGLQWILRGEVQKMDDYKRQLDQALGWRLDESQDFGNEAFRLIRAIIHEIENDLFLVGDAHQRIYGHQVVLSRCGIDVRGRGRKLRINYRTTEELKNWAMGLLHGLAFDDLDAGFDDNSGVRSLFHGEAPMVLSCSNESLAGERFASHVKELLESAMPQESICVVAPTHRELEGYERYVQSVCPETHRIETGKAEDIGKPGIRLATIHRVKGLEFDHVLLADSFSTRSSALSDESAKKKRALLYVAATRARKSLLFCAKSAQLISSVTASRAGSS